MFRLHLYLQHYSCFIGVRQSKSPSRCKSWLKVEIIADNWRCCIHILEGEHQKRLFLPDFYRDYRWDFESLYGWGKGGWWASPTGAAWSLDCVLVDHPGGLRRAINELLPSKAIWSKWASSHQSGHPTTIQENIWSGHLPIQMIMCQQRPSDPSGLYWFQMAIFPSKWTQSKEIPCVGAWGPGGVLLEYLVQEKQAEQTIRARLPGCAHHPVHHREGDKGIEIEWLWWWWFSKCWWWWSPKLWISPCIPS